MKQKFNSLINRLKLIFALFFLIALIQVASAQNIYVSTGGSDLNSGTKLSPLATLEKATSLAYQEFQKNKHSEITIWMNDGVYPIVNPLVFESFSSGVSANLVIKAMPESHPVLSGGKKLTGWRLNSDHLWEVQIPTMQNKYPRELFVNNHRAVRARFPNEGYLRVKQVGADRRTNFFFNVEDFPVPQKLNGVELVLLHDWSISRTGVKKIDKELNQLTAIDSIGARNPEFFTLDHWEPNPRYFLENAPEFLDKDYEWVLLPGDNKILLKLPENINPENLNIYIPVSEGLIEVKGSVNKSVRNIHFEGITFRHSAWNIPLKGYCGVQACHFDSRSEQNGWKVVPAAIKAAWAENCTFKNCLFENLGGSGIWLEKGCKNCVIENSEFTDISGNGIMIGEGRDRKINGNSWWKVAPEQVAQGNRITNCIVRECGKQFYGAVGIWCGLTAETTISNNEIYNLPYSGISVGWMWSPEPTPCRRNVVEGNHIHHIMQILSDGGGIYMLGLQPDSKLTGNRIHDVKINAGRAESNGMFLDEGTTDVVVAGNLIYNIAKSPLRFHRATTNLVKDNFLFYTNQNPPIRYNTTKEEDIIKEGNKVFTEGDENYEEELNNAVLKWLKK